MFKRLTLSIFALCLVTVGTGLFFGWYGARVINKSNASYTQAANALIAHSMLAATADYLPQLLNANNRTASAKEYVADLNLMRALDGLIGAQMSNSPIKAVQIRNNAQVVLYQSGASELIGSSAPAHGAPTYTTLLPILLRGNADAVGELAVSTQYLDRYYQSQQSKHNVYMRIGVAAALIVALLLVLWQWLRVRLREEYARINALQLKYEHLALHDAVTGLHNRHSFINKLDEFAQNCEQDYNNFAVFMMDIDHFKSVNESIGHSAGNELIKEASGRLESVVVGQNAVVARLGGDEFGIIVQNMCDLQSATSIAKKLINQFRTPFHIDDKEVGISISIGVVICQGSDILAEEVMRDADVAMYRAKQNGRGCYELFNPHMHVEAMERIEIEKDIKRGIANNEIFNRYQPIVDLETNVTHSLEALARWAHPEKGELAPAYFIDIAEETGLIHGIDRRVLRLALQDLVKWQKSMASLQNLSVSVNHSARNFSSRPTMDNIYRNLADNEMSGRNLKIELTESSIIDNEVLAFSMFEELRSKGIHLCMDDFGTGFSSLSYLRKLNFDMLKIDMSFVRDMVDDIDARKIVQTMIDMGNNLGIAVTAEGVEDKAQLDLLVSMGCRYAQGYYFAKPLLAADVLPFIKEQMRARQN